jgi:type I restriction enzyme S subunit
VSRRHFARVAQGTSQKHIYARDFQSLKVILPPLEEQKAIAQVLSDFDNLIDGLERLIAKKRSIKEGVIQELLRPKEGWVVKKLKEVLSYEQPTKYLVRSSAYQSHFITPVLTAGKTFLLGNTDENFGIYDKLPVIIFDDFTTASKYVAFPFKAKSSALKMLKARSENFNLKLLFEILNSLKFEVSDHKRHWISEFANIEISIPSTRVEQNKIARAIGDLDEDLSLLEGKLFKFNQIKQGVLNELLTGKTRLI